MIINVTPSQMKSLRPYVQMSTIESWPHVIRILGPTVGLEPPMTVTFVPQLEECAVFLTCPHSPPCKPEWYCQVK